MQKYSYNNFISQNIDELNINEAILACTAPLAEIILTRKYYSGRNSDLKDFTLNYLIEDYRDYLFDSRPMLYARIVKDIFKQPKKEEIEFNKKKIEKLKNIQMFLKENNNEIFSDKSSNPVTKKSQSNSIDGWRKIINPRGWKWNLLTYTKETIWDIRIS